jgi:hypothetical protein
MTNLRNILILFAIVLSGCIKHADNDPMTLLDLGILNHYGSGYMIITDGGNVLLAESIPVNIDFDDNARVSIQYRIIQRAPQNDSIQADYLVQVDGINELITKEIITVDDNNRDTLGNAPVEFRQVWITQDFLTVYYSFYVGSKYHDFNLTYDIDEQADDEFIYLTFRHNDNNDEEVQQYWAYVTFRLNSLRKEGQSEVKIHFRGKQNNENDYIKSDLVYKY